MGTVAKLLRLGGSLVLVVAASGGVLYWWKASDGQMSSREEENEVVRKREHYVRIQHMCTGTVRNLLPALKDAVTSVLNTDAITAQLRSNPSNKLALWENLKLISFSRAVVSACVCGMLVVLLRIQLSVLGAFMYRGLHAFRHATAVSADTQRQYLASTHTLLQKGLGLLAQVVRTATEQELLHHSLKHQLTLPQVQDLINGIFEQASLSAGGHRLTHMEQHDSSGEGGSRLVSSLPVLTHSPLSSCDPRSGLHSWLLQFVLPQDSSLPIEGREGMGQLLSATQDALETHDVQVILESVVERALLHLSRQMTDSFLSAAQGQLSIPLARIIPLVCDHSVLFLEPNNSHALLQELVNTEDLMSVARNVYEAFSSE